MRRVIKFGQVIRNNWKKSTFAAALISYGVNYGKKSYDTRQLMRGFCEEAAKYGDEPQPLTRPLRRITVILNPAANKRKCKELYEKYCAPLLHLAGVLVTVVQTEFEGQARDLPAALDPMTDAILIAGGDGTAAEIVTGLMRRAEGNMRALHSLPIAVLPLGRRSELANSLHANEDDIRALAEATMSVIDGSLRQLDVIKIEPIQEEGKAVYSLTRVECGAHRDAAARRDKFWMLGPLREYASYLFFGTPSAEEWALEYCEPCRGCSRCYVSEPTRYRWWHSFLPKPKTEPHLLIPNENCNVMKEEVISAVHWSVATDTVDGEVGHPLTTEPQQLTEPRAPQLSIHVGPAQQGMLDFVDEGWGKLNGSKPTSEQVLPSRYLRIMPVLKDDSPIEERWLSIDNEDFEMKPIALTLLPKAISVFTSRRDRQIH